MRAIVAAWLALAVMAAGCAQVRESMPVAAVTGGTVERQDGGEWVAVTRIDPGQTVRAASDATLAVGEDVLVLRDGSQITLAEDGVDLAVGDVLVEGEGLDVRSGAVTLDGSGSYRLQSGVTPRVAVYSGGARVTRPGESQPVNALRELALSTRRFDQTDAPLSYDPRDPIDQRLLPGAIAFDEQIRNLVTAIDATYGREPAAPAFYTSFVSVAEDDVAALAQTAPTQLPDGRVGPPADALVGLFLARAAAGVGALDAQAAADRIAGLRDEGARWGLVAASLGVTSAAFAAVVDQAVERREVAEATAPAPPAAAPPPAPAPPAAASAPVAPAAPPAPAPPPGPAPAPPPPPPPPPSAPPLDLGPAGEVLEDVLDLVPGVGVSSGAPAS